MMPFQELCSAGKRAEKILLKRILPEKTYLLLDFTEIQEGTKHEKKTTALSSQVCYVQVCVVNRRLVSLMDFHVEKTASENEAEDSVAMIITFSFLF